MGNTSRGLSFLYCGIAYLMALGAGIPVFLLFRDRGILMATFLADIAATLVVWSWGVLWKNASFYDPYWSVAPLVILPLWLWTSGGAIGLADILFIIAICGWGLRLTYNWAVRWRGIAHQDWRYTMLKEKNPGLWPITNLMGINLMPTVLVFGGMVPVYYAVTSRGAAGIWTFVGFAVCIAAALIQAIADKQMDVFKKSAPGEGRHIDTGLWRYSRHPNYFGEVSFWWGLWLMQMGITPVWVSVAGPIAITLLFVFISIPMMERHVAAGKPGYAVYQREVPMLVPFPRRRKMSA